MGEIVQRAWGTYEVLLEGPRYKVKRLIMEPGQTFSYQYHHHRAEVWTVVAGSALVKLGVADPSGAALHPAERFVPEGQTVLIPLGHAHKMTNPGKIPLHIIEVQYGSYLEEDDIVRLD